MRHGLAVLLLVISVGTLQGISSGQSQAPAQPSPREKCPVCGMFVAGYKDFLAAATFKDGASLYFDGPKDTFRFLFDPAKYAPGRSRADVQAVWVTDYYSLKMIDGSTALFIRGSDVLGPMGAELVPFAKEEEAKEFMTDHKGKEILRFADITPEVIGSLD